MFNTPITGNSELDAYLAQLALETDANNGVLVDSNTGKIYDGNTGNILYYLYQYIQVKYADDNIGTNLSNSPTNKLFFGINNSASTTESTNPADYTWYLASGGFSTNKFLYYLVNGGRQITFAVATSAPSSSYVVDSGSAIDLDVVTASTANAAAAAAQSTATAAQSTATTAQSTATTAQSTAVAAQDTANTAQSTAVSAQSTANSAISGLANKLNKSASDILSGDITFNSAGGFKTGTIAIDGSGNVTGAGVAFTSKGITGRTNAKTTFTIESTTGNATFAGNIESEGQFKLSGLGYTYGGAVAQNTVALIDGSQTLVGVYAKGGDIFSKAILAESAGGIGIQASSTGPASIGVYAFADGYGQGIIASNSSALGLALNILGKASINNNFEVPNLNANYLQGYTASSFYVSGSALGTPSSGNLSNCTFPTLNQNTTGNAATASYATSAGSASTASYATSAGSATIASDSVALGGVYSSNWARIFVGDTGTGNAGGAGMNFNCLISGYRFRGTSNFMYLEPVSDRRLKENIQPETLGLNFVNSLKPVTYNMIGNKRKSHGFIAQDVESLINNNNDSLKIENEQGVKGVDYISLIAPLVKSIQELTDKIELLETRLKG